MQKRGQLIVFGPRNPDVSRRKECIVVVACSRSFLVNRTQANTPTSTPHDTTQYNSVTHTLSHTHCHIHTADPDQYTVRYITKPDQAQLPGHQHALYFVFHMLRRSLSVLCRSPHRWTAFVRARYRRTLCSRYGRGQPANPAAGRLRPVSRQSVDNYKCELHFCAVRVSRNLQEAHGIARKAVEFPSVYSAPLDT
jgi:hypothetical protein